MNICEKCFKDHDGSYGSGRFCNVKCANSRIRSKEIKEKVSKKLIGRKKSKLWIENPANRNCKFCNVEFLASHPLQLACSRDCVRKKGSLALSEEQKIQKSKKMSAIAKKRHEAGEKFGWSSRFKIKPSYPESIAIKFFELNNISFIRELPVGKYFVDFAIEDKKLAIEIDGQQHKKPDRAESDKKKDVVLNESGWKVLRIKWPEENIIKTLSQLFNVKIENIV